MDRAPLQIYSSVLIFSPENSIVRKQFTNLFPSWISKFPRVNTDWDPCLMTLESRGNSLVSVRLTTDGQKVMSKTSLDIIQIWDLTTSHCLLTIDTRKEEMGGAVRFQLSPCGKSFLYALGNVIQLRDIDNNDCNSILRGHLDDIILAIFSSDGKYIASASSCAALKIWNSETCHCISSFQVQGSGVEMIEFSPNSTTIMSVSSESKLDIWDIATGICIATCNALVRDYIFRPMFSPNSQKVALRSSSSTMIIWDIYKDKYFYLPEVSNQNKDIGAFSPDGDQFIWVEQGKNISTTDQMSVWNFPLGTNTKFFTGHPKFITRIRYSPDGTKVASASMDKTIQIWNPSTGECLSTLRGHSLGVTDIMFSSDGSIIMSASEDGNIKMWDANSFNFTSTANVHNSGVLWVMFSPNGGQIASAASDWSLRVSDLSGSCIISDDSHWTWEWIPIVLRNPDDSFEFHVKRDGHRSWSRSAVYSTNSASLVSVEGKPRLGSFLKIVDTITGNFIISNDFHSVNIKSIEFSMDGEKLVSICRGGTVKIWSASTGKLISTFSGEEGASGQCARFSPDGAMVACSAGRASAGVRVWDLSSGLCIASFGGKNDYISALAFSPDSTTLVSASELSVVVLNISTNENTTIYRTSAPWEPKSLTFAPDGSKFAVLCSFRHENDSKPHRLKEDSLGIWDSATGHCISVMGIGRLVNNICFDADGRRLLTTIGSITLRQDPSTPSKLSANEEGDDLRPTHDLLRQGIGLSTDGEWILWGLKKMLWLPPSLRPTASDVFGSHIVIGSGSGQVIWLGMRP